jgi:hypothetical protein
MGGNLHNLDATLNAVCPYFTMFPLEFPLEVLARNRDPESWVLDPFCGRGTTNFAARLRGLPSVGVDSSPVAVAIAQSKVVSTSPRAVVNCAKNILERFRPSRVPEPEGMFWKKAFHPRTLHRLCHLRQELIADCKSPERKALRAILLGSLHGPLTKSTPSYFSNQCPRTFAPKPEYAVRFWKKHNFRAPLVDVIPLVQTRAERYFATCLPGIRSDIIEADSRAWKDKRSRRRFSWVITSPPYYGMRTYVPDQWLRNWFVGGPDGVDYSARVVDFQHSSPEEFSGQLRRVWVNAAQMSHPQARLVCRFGGIHDRKQDCLEIIKNSFLDSGWRVTTIRDAGTASQGRRQAIQMGDGQKEHPRSEYDVYARICS